jgi:prevent-host-death family protein
MSKVTIRELSRNPSGVVDDVTRTGRPALVTRHGALVAAMIPLSAEELEDWVLAKSPELLEDLLAADREIAAGKTRPADDLFAELDLRE